MDTCDIYTLSRIGETEKVVTSYSFVQSDKTETFVIMFSENFPSDQLLR